jgi:hypothetical protein
MRIFQYVGINDEDNSSIKMSLFELCNQYLGSNLSCLRSRLENWPFFVNYFLPKSSEK